MKFEQLGLAEPILRATRSAGYVQATPIQAGAIPHAAAGKDVLGCAQTGTGKTAAFALPVLHRLLSTSPKAATGDRSRRRPIRALVLSPTRELAGQIGDSFREYGQHTKLLNAVIFGGVSQYPQTQALRNGIDILVATPGRLCDLMNQGFVDLKQIEIFVLDEADRMLDMGFLPDIRRVIDALPKERQTLFFSATMPTEIGKLAHSILRDPVKVEIAPVKETTELIEQSVCFVSQTDKPRLLAHLIGAGTAGRVLVFTRTKHGADRVVKQLSKVGIRAEALHGNKSQAVRLRTLANFKAHRNGVLVATDIAARGIDVDGISHVINYELPHEPETYVHRIGRTGRAGAAGLALSFCNAEERKLLRLIERLIRKPLTAIPLPADLPVIAKDAPGEGGGSSEREPRRHPASHAAEGARRTRRPAPAHGAPRRAVEARDDAAAATGPATGRPQGRPAGGAGAEAGPGRSYRGRRSNRPGAPGAAGKPRRRKFADSKS